MKFRLLTILLQLISLLAMSRNDTIQFQAVRTEHPPKIDGILNDESWKHAVPLTNFVQYDPFQGREPTFQTVVYVLYDDEAIYFGAKMLDTSSDSVLMQLGNRDTDLNADDITFQFDPFSNNQDAYYFRVTSSNVQSEWRKKDASYNAVWHSKTTVSEEAWCAEIKIPYSSIRIPPVSIHSWKFQITRNIRRYREFSKLTPEKKGVDNDMIFWGSLVGITEIQTPVRLALTPYLSVFAEIHSNQPGQSRNFSISPIGGLDLKYGINESFTLDLTLLPDFSQVKSDDVVKNLSAFEVNFSEQRPFFLESMDLFKLGNLFYSRRIGRFPSKYYSAENTLQEDEEMISNPASVSLINSFKITGQTSKGLSVGVLNAITDRAFAEIQTADGKIRKHETEPMANYNVFVLRQALKYNSSVYLINTNVLREGRNQTANVTGSGVKLYTPENTYSLTLNASANSKFYNVRETEHASAGYAWNGMLAKVRGNMQYYYYYQMKNDRYDINDMGMNYTNDEAHHEAQLAYKIFDPFWKLLRLNTGVNIWRSNRITTGKPTSVGIDLSASTTTDTHFSVWTNGSWYFADSYDYYEPRTEGYFYIVPKGYEMYLGFSSDYRKNFALDGSVNFSGRPEIGNRYYAFNLTPIIRVTNHFQFNFSASVKQNINSRGFAGKDENELPVFGNRDVTTIENAFNGTYVFVNNLSLSVRFRHYWSKGIYDRFYVLDVNGRLNDASANLRFDNFTFNSFLLDLVFSWEFAPGSNLTLVWKNSIIDELNYAFHGYWNNLENTFTQPQTNLLSMKFLYYLDYHTLRSRTRKF